MARFDFKCDKCDYIEEFNIDRDKLYEFDELCPACGKTNLKRVYGRVNLGRSAKPTTKLKPRKRKREQ